MEDPLSEQCISLGKMPQQAGVREAREDWTGVINRKERRKLQNRLNQRRFREYSSAMCLMKNTTYASFESFSFSLLGRVEKTRSWSQSAGDSFSFCLQFTHSALALNGGAARNR